MLVESRNTLSPSAIFVALMIAVEALLHAPHKISDAKCPVGEPLSILHKYYQPGDFIIAGIFSQIYIFSSPISYEMPPSEESFDDLVKDLIHCAMTIVIQVQ
ncbi:hypothetical protein E2320_022932, partial [Naja naja]